LVFIFLCFAGENDLYNQVVTQPGSVLRTIQEKTKSYFGFVLPLFHGRGIFTYKFGLLPNRRPLKTVVGAPISVPLIEQPTKEEGIWFASVIEMKHCFLQWTNFIKFMWRL
jgi:hypothetical protein